MDWIHIISGVLGLLGLGGCGILFYRQERQKKELDNASTAIQNASATNEEWIKLYKTALEEVSAYREEVKAQRDAKIELRNQCADYRVKNEHLTQWKCERTNCLKRRPQSPATMTEDHTND